MQTSPNQPEVGKALQTLKDAGVTVVVVQPPSPQSEPKEADGVDWAHFRAMREYYAKDPDGY